MDGVRYLRISDAIIREYFDDIADSRSQWRSDSPIFNVDVEVVLIQVKCVCGRRGEHEKGP
jgi:hypothetical protein